VIKQAPGRLFTVVQQLLETPAGRPAFLSPIHRLVIQHPINWAGIVFIFYLQAK
jgi:hypothetical protein